MKVLGYKKWLAVNPGSVWSCFMPPTLGGIVVLGRSRKGNDFGQSSGILAV